MTSMVCYYVFLGRDKREHIDRIKPLLPKKVFDESAVFISSADRARHLAGRRILQQALTDFRLLHSISDIRYTSSGKPFFDNGFHFSISHSQELVAGIFSKSAQVGIDVQHHLPIPLEEYKDLLSAQDFKFIREARKPLAAFYEIWTRKESIVKADGRGMLLNFSEIALKGDLARVNIGKIQMHWETRSLAFKNNYTVSVCSQVLPETIEFRELNT